MRINRLESKMFFTLPIVGILIASALPAVAQEAEWIWHPSGSKNNTPIGSTYFRKSFNANNVEQAEILIAADDKYDLFLNNKRIGSGSGTESLDKYDVSSKIRKGKNVIAVRVDNIKGKTGALAARVQVKEKGDSWDSYSTNRTWKTSTSPLPIWKFQFFNDSGWSSARSFGKLGSTEPWDRPAKVVKQNKSKKTQGNTETPTEQVPDSEFFVENVFGDEEVGSIIAFEFNEFGEIIASPEKGGLFLLRPKARSKTERVKVLTDKIKAIQGILPLNGDIFVTGIYENKLGLFKLKDNDRDDQIDEIKQILKFEGYPGEHGAHGLVLGYDGKIYITLGNHVSYRGPKAENSPYTRTYEGSIVKRYEDPGGHAKGIKAPGGTILRTDLTGENVELVAGGLRNSYDLVFNRLGDLFTHDSDMETDVGLSWYRPTNLFHVVDGADLGWRSGWAKWPEYYVDTVPPVTDTGRGSPTGMVMYNHVMFPVRYQNTMFLADWSRGRIYNVALKKNGASFTAKKEVFVEGSPLNVTDLAVGSDGALYFSTGGRMTNGGIYRVKWKGQVPKAYRTFEDNLSKIIRQPQPQSAYARQQLAELQNEIGGEWDRIVKGVAVSQKNPESYRTHAIDLMTLYGPTPGTELLLRLSEDPKENIRVKAVRAMSSELNSRLESRLTRMLGDKSAYVRRVVCEVLTQHQVKVDYDAIRPLLVSNDVFEAHAARKLLESQSVDSYKRAILDAKNQPEFIRGALALMTATADQDNAYAVLARSSEIMDEFISDKNFVELLRLIQVTIELGEVDAEKIPAFASRMADEFPSGNASMNRELSKILANLNVAPVLGRLDEFLKSTRHTVQDKLDVAMHLQLIEAEWTTDQKLALINYLESQIKRVKEGNYGAFIRIAVREFAKRLTEEESIIVLRKGKDWPNAAMSAFYKLPKKLDDKLFADIRNLDRSIQKETGETYTYIKKGIIAVLAQGGGDQGLEYLKEIWRRDADRRKHVAVAFTLKPNAETWPYLIASINEVEEEATEVMRALLKVPQKPEGAKYYRLVIVKAQTLEDPGKLAATDLLELWTGENTKNKLDPEKAVEGWQDWFVKTFPDESPAVLTEDPKGQKWTVQLLQEVLAESKSKDAKTIGSKANGKLVFKKAQCSNCHRFTDYGDPLGPDLTTLARRFTTKEILESIIHPSDVISDQYRSELIATADGRQISGIVSPGPNDSIVVLRSDGTKVQLTPDNIEARKKTKISVMPANLLEELSKQEIVDLFTYLGLQDENRIAGKQRFITR